MKHSIIFAAAMLAAAAAHATGDKPAKSAAPVGGAANIQTATEQGQGQHQGQGQDQGQGQQQGQQAIGQGTGTASSSVGPVQAGGSGPIAIQGDTVGGSSSSSRALGLVAPSINWGNVAANACMAAGNRGRVFLWGAYASNGPASVDGGLCYVLALADRAAAQCRWLEAAQWRAAAGQMLRLPGVTIETELVNDDPLRCVEARAAAAAPVAAAPVAAPAPQPINVTVNVDLAQAQSQEALRPGFQPKRRPAAPPPAAQEPCPDGRLPVCPQPGEVRR